MNHEEKILGMLEKLTEKVDSMDQRMDRMEGRMDRMEADISGIKVRMDTLETDVSGIKVRMDVDIQKQINLLAESSSRIVERLDALEEVKELAEETRDKVDVIYTVVKQHSGEIAELKRAQ